MLDTKKSIAAAVAAQAMVITITLSLYGVTAGAELDTRNTARMAAIFFAWALATRARPGDGRSAAYGFVAAHAMHFASVAYFSAISAKAPLHQVSLRSAVSVTAGLTVLGALAFTVSAEGVRLKRLNAFTTFIFGFVFTFGAFYNGLGIHHNWWGSAVPLPFLLAAMIWRIRSKDAPLVARAASAS